MTITNDIRYGDNIADEKGIASEPFRAMLDEIVQQINALTPQLLPLTTSANLVDITDPINTTAKFFYKMNSDTGRPVFPRGPAAADLWTEADGITTFTPV